MRLHNKVDNSMQVRHMRKGRTGHKTNEIVKSYKDIHAQLRDSDIILHLISVCHSGVMMASVETELWQSIMNHGSDL